MAVVAVTDSNNRRNGAEATTNWTSDGGGGAGPQQEPDVVYQGSFAVSRKVGTTKGGFQFIEPTGSTDMTVAGDNVIVFKMIATNPSVLIAAPAFGCRIGSAAGNWYEYYIGDDGTQGDITYPVRGGWLLVPVDPNLLHYRDALGGTAPTLTAITKFGLQGDFSASSKSENVICDALDISPGLFLVGGDGADADGTWADFLADDEGTVANRFGHITSQEGVLFCQGLFAIGEDSAGTTTATVFNDSNQVLVFPFTRTDDSWNQIKIDLGNATTDVDFNTTVFKGRGRDDRTNFFSTIGDVDAVAEELDIVGHGYQTGDAVRYTNEGGTDTIGLTTNTVYFVRRVTADAIALYAEGATVGRQNSYSDTTRVNLSAGATGENHKLVRETYTNPDLLVEGTAGVFDANACTFDGFREITLTSAGTLTGCALLSVGGITLASGSLDASSFQTSILEEGEALVTDATIANITDCEFTAEGRGHAVELTSTAGSPYSYSGNTHIGYGPNRAQFGTTSGVNGATEVITTNAAHGFVDGDHVYYNDEGGVASVGLTDGAKYYVNNITTTTLSLHVSKTDAENDLRRVNLTASGAETHSLYSGTAALLNSSGGALTINIAGGGDTPTVRNTPGSTTTVNNSVTIEIIGVTEGTRCSIVRVDNDVELLNALAFTADGQGAFKASTTFAYVSDTAVRLSAAASGKVVAGIAENSGAFTDETLEANDSRGTESMTLLTAAPTIDVDGFYYGHTEQFGQLELDITTAGTGGFVMQWQYWNGSAWTALSGVTDGTSNLSVTGSVIVSWTIPGNWTARSVTNQPGPSNLFYVRQMYQSGTVTVLPVGNTVKLDVTKYRRWEATNTIVSAGLSAKATWVVDDIAVFG